jgi:ankyrin repeat protein
MQKIDKTIWIFLLVFNLASAMDEPSQEKSARSVEKLFDAIESKQLSVVENMLNQDPSLVHQYGIMERVSGFDITPLHVAAACGGSKTIKLLLDNNADPNIKAKQTNVSPLHCITSLKGVCLLLQKKAAVDSKCHTGSAPLQSVLFHHRSDIKFFGTEKRRKIASFLLQNGSKIDHKDRFGNTALHNAIVNNCLTAVDFLLKNGADIGVRNNVGKTPYERAIIDEYCPLLRKVFAKHGIFFFPGLSPCDVFTRLDQDNDDLLITENNVRFYNRWAPIISYACEKRYSLLEDKRPTDPLSNGMICNRYGCMFNNTSYQDLIRFFGEGCIAKIQLRLDDVCKRAIALIENDETEQLQVFLKQFPFITTYGDEYPCLMLCEVLEKNNVKSLKTLLYNGIDFERLNENRILHLAVVNDNAAAIPLLIEHGADCLLLNGEGKTPMSLAVELKRVRCVQVLNQKIIEQFFQAFKQHDYKKSYKLLDQLIDYDCLGDENRGLLYNLVWDIGAPKRFDFIKWLLLKGARPNIRDNGLC